MRVITGSAKGCLLTTLPGEKTRPTSEKVKEGLFSAIQFDIEGRRALDLYAGSGQLGIEALSRGAVSCVFVDRNPDAVAVIRQNLKKCSFSELSQVVSADASAFLERSSDTFDLVFMDPPYADGLLLPTLQMAVTHVNDGGILVCESDEDATLPDKVDRFTLDRVRCYGRTRVWLYRYSAQEGRG
jgi:16S rRNA (guanine(966)-N(2))-methyltransferase RsmD